MTQLIEIKKQNSFWLVYFAGKEILKSVFKPSKKSVIPFIYETDLALSEQMALDLEMSLAY